LKPLQIDFYNLFCKTTKLDELEEGGSTDSELKLGNTIGCDYSNEKILLSS